MTTVIKRFFLIFKVIPIVREIQCSIFKQLWRLMKCIKNIVLIFFNPLKVKKKKV